MENKQTNEHTKMKNIAALHQHNDTYFSPLRKKEKKIKMSEPSWFSPLVLASLDCLKHHSVLLWFRNRVEFFLLFPHVFLSTPSENFQLINYKLL